MLLAMKDEARSNLNSEEDDFMLGTSYGEYTIEELTAAVMLMARIQPADDNAETVPSYDAKAVSENDDQMDSNIIFDNPYVENNGGTSDHDSNDHDEYHKIQMLAYDVQREAENQKRLNNELKKQKMLLQQEFETCKDRVKLFESKTLQCSKYKETCEELERELRNNKNTIGRLLKEKDNIQSDFFQNRKKLSSHDRIVYKMIQSIQTIHMLGKTPNKVYDPFLKAGLGYKNPERLKKAVAAQPKMYDGEKLHSTKLVIDSPDSEETLEDAEESRLKMRNKMVQLNYGKLNALYETFIPQQRFSMEQTCFSIPSTSTDGSESKAVTSDLPILKMPKESKLLKMFDTLGIAINGLRTRIDITLLEDRQRRWISDSQNSLREFYKNDLLKDELAKSSNDSKDIQANLLTRIKILENDFKRSQAQSIDFELKLQHQKYKMACDVSWKSKLSTLNDENVLLKTQVESVVQERENVKLEYQKLFSSIKATRTQHKKEIDELIEHVNQKTYAYADVHAQN
ncbi:hypothetical protein Tco_1540944 [Tanacetum coccineum]